MTREDFEHRVLTRMPRLSHIATICYDTGCKHDDPVFLPCLLAAVADRESNGRNIRGADGHGCGIWQFDDRYFPDYCVEGGVAWAPEKACRAAAEYLLKLRSAAPTWSVAIAAYNCGLRRAREAYDAGDVDSHTTGGDYSAWVLARVARLEKP